MHKENEQSSDPLSQYESSFKTLAQIVQEGICMVNCEGRILYANDTCALLMECSAEEMKHKYIYEFCYAEEYSDMRTHLRNSLEGNKEQFSFRLRNYTHKEVAVRVRTHPLKEESGRIGGVIYLFQDMRLHKDLDSRKDDFITMASHELKTPVTCIKAFSQIVLSQHAVSTEKTHQYLSKINTQTNRLLKLINEILDVSKIRTGKLILTKEWFQLEPFIDSLMHKYHTQSQGHTIRVLEKADTSIFADKDRIAQVIDNIVHNAIKYSPEGTFIDIAVRAEKGHNTFSVTDQGIGIKPDDQVNLFKPYHRIMHSDEKEFPGLGIGLFIAAEIIKKHNGSIHLTSVYGQGSTVTFTLPVE